ncbi:MAG: MFS transporter [Actinomycetia bacterium]|nr:MFS transporter [Actinomycetes bacterium]MCP4085838.1 MFS transporter [Actinomycetes bacterium]
MATSSPSGSAPGVAKAPFWGWRVVAAGAGANLLAAALIQHAFTNYSVLLREEFQWSTTMLAAAFAMTRLESGLLGPIQGWMLDRFGPKRVMTVGAVLFGVGLMLLSTLQNPVQFFAYYFIVAVGASLGGFITVVTAVVGWFHRRRSFAVSVAQSGFALGGVFTPIVVFFMDRYGWRPTAFVSGVIGMIGIGACAQFMYRDPASVGQEVDGGPDLDDRDSATLTTETINFTIQQAVRTRAFWMLNLGHSSALLVVSATMAHLSIYLTEEQGFPLQRAGYLLGALLVVQFVGQLAGGRLGDLVNKQWLVMGAMVGHVAGMLVLTFASSPLIWLFVPLHGLAWGVRGPLMQAMRADYFGPKSFGTIMGWSSMIMMVGTMTGPLLVGYLRDQTDSYTRGFTVVTAMASVAIVFFALASRPPRPVDA